MCHEASGSERWSEVAGRAVAAGAAGISFGVEVLRGE